MFNFIRRWRLNRQRNIFRFWNGSRECRADPLAVWRSINADPEFSLIKHPEMIDAGDMDAIRIGVATVRRIFSIPSLEKGGLTEQECLDLLIDFFDYTAALKKNINLPLTLRSPMASEPLQQPTAVTSTTRPPADLSSTAIEPSDATAPE